jgi:hypothetical protein
MHFHRRKRKPTPSLDTESSRPLSCVYHICLSPPSHRMGGHDIDSTRTYSGKQH